MDIIFRMFANIKTDEGLNIWTLFKKIDNVNIVPRKGEYISDEIYDDYLEVEQISFNYEDNSVDVFLKDINIDEKEQLNRLKKQLEDEKWYLVED